MFKGTVSGISGGSPCKDGNARFTTGPLKPLSYLPHFNRKVSRVPFNSGIAIFALRVNLNYVNSPFKAKKE